MDNAPKYEAGPIDPGTITCAKCGERPVPRSVTLGYMNSAFQVELPACPVCGMIFIAEELARGRMLHVEKSLEDK